MEIDLSNPAASGGGRGREPGRPEEGRPRPGPACAQGGSSGAVAAHMQAQAAFETGLRRPMVEADEPEPAVPARSQVPAEPLEPGAAPRAGQAAGAQAGQGPRRRPADAHRRPARTARSPGRTSSAAAVGWRRRLRACGSPVRRTPGEGAGDPRADQGRPQDDGRRDGAVGVHRPARDRVGHRRRDPHDGVRRAAQGAPRVPRREGLAAAGAGPRGDARDAAYAGDQLVLGRGRAARSCSSTTSTSASPRPPRAAWSSRTSRTPRTSRCSSWPARSSELTATARDGKTQPAEMSRRHVHDHQRRRLRRRRRHPDHQPRRVRDPVLRRDQEAAVGGRRRDRGARR